jgi:uncharacterized repeat protein (TIGR04138 family)
MNDQAQQDELRSLLRAAGPYPLEAYQFVQEGLSFTSQQVHLDPDMYGELDRHVTGQQLCMGLREYAIQRYGLLARTVLECWRVQRTEDFGRMVFAMIDAGLLKQQADDSLEDFSSVYDFREAFNPRDIEEAIGTALSS